MVPLMSQSVERAYCRPHISAAFFLVLSLHFAMKSSPRALISLISFSNVLFV